MKPLKLKTMKTTKLISMLNKVYEKLYNWIRSERVITLFFIISLFLAIGKYFSHGFPITNDTLICLFLCEILVMQNKPQTRWVGALCAFSFVLSPTMTIVPPMSLVDKLPLYYSISSIIFFIIATSTCIKLIFFESDKTESIECDHEKELTENNPLESR